jgi:hypothetical protein
MIMKTTSVDPYMSVFLICTNSQRDHLPEAKLDTITGIDYPSIADTFSK